MAHRPIQTKKINKLRKLMRSTPETFIDPVQWLKDRGYAPTSGEARRMVLAGRLMSESHKVGIKQVPQVNERGTDFVRGSDGKPVMIDVVGLVPATLRSTLRVASA